MLGLTSRLALGKRWVARATAQLGKNSVKSFSSASDFTVQASLTQQSERPLSAAMSAPFNTNYGKESSSFADYSAAWLWAALAAAMLVGSVTQAEPSPGAAKSSKIYTIEEVAKHKTKATGVWVIYQDGVYDITKFVANHPGGQDKIMLAAGGDIAPFWNLYRQHFNSPLPRELLANMRIGSLSQEDVRRMQASRSPGDDKDPYNKDPALSPVMHYLSRKPINAEPPLFLLTDSWITPTELWFVRNHHPVVNADPATFTVSVNFDKPVVPSTIGAGTKGSADGKAALTQPRTLSLEDIKSKYKAYSVVATIQCGGNRRVEMSAVERTNGSGWSGAISTAKWTGARLRDVLLEALATQGLTEDDVLAEGSKINHVHFLGADNMQASIPIRKALSREGDVLLAYSMNDRPIPSQHGAPLRAVVPGHVGVRNVKWVTGIVLSEEEAPGPWQRGMAYKGFGPSVRSLEGIDVEAIPSLQEQPVQSAITVPAPTASNAAGTVAVTAGEPLTVRGYAYSGGGRGIIRVDVSIDGGKTWQDATLLDGSAVASKEANEHKQALDRAWAWTFWETEFPIPDTKAGAKLEIICKATDASYNVQPDTVQGVWNLRGINNNAWPRVHAEVFHPEPEPDEE